MVNDKMSKLDRLEEAINEDILAMTPEEILEEAKAEGEDTAAFAKSMDAWLQGAIAQADSTRLKDARAALERDRNRSKANVVPMRKREAKSRPEGFTPDTMAARNGKELSERDKAALDEDFDELFDDDAWGDDQDEPDK
ncbi:hypothetical protein BXY70_0784 [Roseovarius halotolerans]|uniref:Uncharacterized protein n=1 Tax=Roseovarius halotolerans TaxID=505353 RepID=A0A1X6YFK3_9RHOB|nr:hypothetical protein [Roseovarius halotolerans]RKT34761.1 hypothetical protein BXY70_0784 [Roseovarius halotolerans]SLN19106.1 hypothetical protein ROH8110_00613 [Roseovarius halotolerans]